MALPLLRTPQPDPKGLEPRQINNLRADTTTFCAHQQPKS